MEFVEMAYEGCWHTYSLKLYPYHGKYVSTCWILQLSRSFRCTKEQMCNQCENKTRFDKVRTTKLSPFSLPDGIRECACALKGAYGLQVREFAGYSFVFL